MDGYHEKEWENIEASFIGSSGSGEFFFLKKKTLCSYYNKNLKKQNFIGHIQILNLGMCLTLINYPQLSLTPAFYGENPVPFESKFQPDSRDNFRG